MGKPNENEPNPPIGVELKLTKGLLKHELGLLKRLESSPHVNIMDDMARAYLKALIVLVKRAAETPTQTNRSVNLDLVVMSPTISVEYSLTTAAVHQWWFAHNRTDMAAMEMGATVSQQPPERTKCMPVCDALSQCEVARRSPLYRTIVARRKPRMTEKRAVDGPRLETQPKEANELTTAPTAGNTVYRRLHPQLVQRKSTNPDHDKSRVQTSAAAHTETSEVTPRPTDGPDRRFRRAKGRKRKHRKGEPNRTGQRQGGPSRAKEFTTDCR